MLLVKKERGKDEMRQIINESDFSVSWMKKYKREIKSCKGKKTKWEECGGWEGRGLGAWGGIGTLTGGRSGDVANRVSTN